LVIDVVLGYQKDDFSKSDIQRFFSSEYKVNQDSDRMGYRLDGEALNPNLQGIYSEGISFGAIQVPANGLPIILLKDRQTLGGYPKLGTVVSVDAFRLSQCRPGHSVTFREVSLNSAQTRVREFYQFFS
jgi:allophanate hydrolase subunit 2